MTNKTKSQQPKKAYQNKPKQTKQLAIVDHARIDPSHCLADRLFRPLFRGSQKSAALDVSYKARNSKLLLHWTGPELLSISDQSIFLAIHRIAVQPECVERVGQNHPNPTFIKAREELHFAYQAVPLECLVITTTLKEIGAITQDTSLNGQARTRILQTLNRLSQVTLDIYDDSNPTAIAWQSRLISTSVSGKIVNIGINPMLSKAILTAPTTFIDMREQRALSGDVSKRLHVWLSSWFGANRVLEVRGIKRDTLISNIWGDVGQGDALYSRRSTLLTVLDELNTLEGWSFSNDTRSNVITIQRQPVKKVENVEEDGSEKSDSTDGLPDSTDGHSDLTDGNPDLTDGFSFAV